MNDTLDSPVLTQKNRILVYLLSSPEDKDECICIKKYLSPIIRNSQTPIEICSDFDVIAGNEIDKYKAHLYEADIVLALISADFINNDDTYLRTQKVIEKYNRNEVIIFPILIRNCLWKSTPFVKLPLLPKNFQPLNNKQFWNSEDDAFTVVVTDISEAINKFSVEQSAVNLPASNNNYEHTKQPIVRESTAANGNTVQENTMTATPVQSTFSTHKDRAAAIVPLKVAWRKRYYKNVLWKRAAAFFLDNILTFLPVFLISVYISVYIVVGIEVSDDITALLLLLFITLSIFLIVCAFIESSRLRGTFGKRILKLQITDRDGRSISFSRALWRNLLRWIIGYSYLLIIPLVIQYFTFKKTKQLFHDQISFTVIGEKLSN